MENKPLLPENPSAAEILEQQTNDVENTQDNEVDDGTQFKKAKRNTLYSM